MTFAIDGGSENQPVHAPHRSYSDSTGRSRSWFFVGSKPLNSAMAASPSLRRWYRAWGRYRFRPLKPGDLTLEAFPKPCVPGWHGLTRRGRPWLLQAPRPGFARPCHPDIKFWDSL